MFDTSKATTARFNRSEFREKVLGCWTGKNIGGTLGAPFENKQQVFNVSFYTSDLKGDPIPNDDLDLQLVWLHAIEEHGLSNINERVLGEYWLSYVIGPWEEYGICRANMINGLYPPLSGACNNPMWHNGNGAWIRSEIWACLFPGSPDEAIQYAWCDACVDHSGDGIYAEIFTTALESAAFIETDIRKLIDIALKRIPSDCRVARAVRTAIAEYEAGRDFVAARAAVVKEIEDLGWFHAPGNVAFMVIGLLYGEGDFSKAVCTAVNCGDDADCTAATVGAVMGIILGRSGIPRRWVDPIGENIKTVAILNAFLCEIPATLDELTDRTVALKNIASAENPTLPGLTDGATEIPETYKTAVLDSDSGLRRIRMRCSMRLTFPVSWGKVAVEYGESPVMKAGTAQKMRLWVPTTNLGCSNVYFRWMLPEGWTCSPSPELVMMQKIGTRHCLEFEIAMPENARALTYIPLEVRHSGRNSPDWITIPFQLDGTVKTCSSNLCPDQEFYDRRNIALSRIQS